MAATATFPWSTMATSWASSRAGISTATKRRVWIPKQGYGSACELWIARHAIGGRGRGVQGARDIIRHLRLVAVPDAAERTDRALLVPIHAQIHQRPGLFVHHQKARRSH